MRSPVPARLPVAASLAIAAVLALAGGLAMAHDGNLGQDTPSPPAATAPVVAPSCIPARRAQGKVLDVYWSQGPDNKRVTGATVNHYVDLNLTVLTSGYLKGDCVDVTIQANDGRDIVEGKTTLTFYGRVDARGVAFFKEPLRNHTLILSASEDESSAEESAPVAAPASAGPRQTGDKTDNQADPGKPAKTGPGGV